ncbi:hypothetical protein D3C81_1386300 [compost metagenome]
MHGLGHGEVGNPGGGVGILEQVDVVALDRGVQRRTEVLPVGEQLVERARLEHRAGEDVGADFGAFLDHADAELLAGFGGLLLQAAGGGKSGGAGTDDDDVEFHVFAFHSLILLTQGWQSASWSPQGRFLCGAIYLRCMARPVQAFARAPADALILKSGAYTVEVLSY